MLSEKFSWVVITNPRAEREFDFLVQAVGEEKIIDAKAALGARMAYPLNLARILGVTLPEDLQFTPLAEAQKKIKEIISNLHRARAGGGGG